MSNRSASSFLNDEDDDDGLIPDLSSFGDEDEDTRDDFLAESRRSMNSPHAMQSSEDQKRSAQRESEPSSRIAKYKEVQAFVQSFAEATPIYLSVRAKMPGRTENEVMREVASVSDKHFNLVEKCLSLHDADPQDLMLRYQRRQLSKIIAELYSKISQNEIDEIIEFSNKLRVSTSDLNDDASNKYNISSESILNAKWMIFSLGIKLTGELSALYTQSIPVYIIKEIQSTALSLAKELAYGWSESKDSMDINSLFFNIFPFVFQVVQDTYKELLFSEMDDPEHSYFYQDPEMPLPHTEAAIQDLDMGYEGDRKTNLIMRLRAIALAEIPKLDACTLSASQRERFINAAIEAKDKLLAEAWSEVANDFISKISQMSIEERAQFAKSSEMDLTDFMALVQEKFSELESPLEDIDIDSDDLIERSRAHLVWIWGLSNSLTKARSQRMSR